MTDDITLDAPRAPRSVTVAITALFLVAVCMVVDGVFVLTHIGAFVHEAQVSAQNCTPSSTQKCATPDQAKSFANEIEIALGVVLLVLGIALGVLARAASRPSRGIRRGLWGVGVLALICFGCGGWLGGVAVPNSAGTLSPPSTIGEIANYLLLLGTLGLLLGIVLLFLPSARGYYSGIPAIPLSDVSPIVGDRARASGGLLSRDLMAKAPQQRSAAKSASAGRTPARSTTASGTPAKSATAAKSPAKSSNAKAGTAATASPDDAEAPAVKRGPVKRAPAAKRAPAKRSPATPTEGAADSKE